MIQTQLLRLDPPYQIIAAAGKVGIQLATLIVTEEKTTEDGQYVIDTHSHPVVSYGLKQGLETELKYAHMIPAENSNLVRLQPEGAVWNKVEISDVRVLGLAGIENEAMTQEDFISMVPTDPQFTPVDRVWNEISIAKIYDTRYRLSAVGIKCADFTSSLDYNGDCAVLINLQLNILSNSVPTVSVVIRDLEMCDFPLEGEIKFNVRLFDDDDNQQIERCVENIQNAMRALMNIFMRKEHLFFYHNKLKEYKGNPLEDFVEEVTRRVNEESKSWR